MNYNGLDQRELTQLRRAAKGHVTYFLPFTEAANEDVANRLSERGYLKKRPWHWMSALFFVYDLTEEGRKVLASNL